MGDVDEEVLSKALAYIEDDDWEQLSQLVDVHPGVMKHPEVADYLGWLHFDQLTQAMFATDYVEVERIIAEHPDVLTRYDDNLIHWTALHWAVSESDLRLVKILLDAGADVNQHNEPIAGGTALALAVENEEFKIADFLLDRGANPNITGWMWQTPIDKLLDGLQEARFEKNHQRSKYKDQHAARGLLKRMTSAAKQFEPPVYPDGTVPEFWPPTPERPDPKRVPRKK